MVDLKTNYFHLLHMFGMFLTFFDDALKVTVKRKEKQWCFREVDNNSTW